MNTLLNKFDLVSVFLSILLSSAPLILSACSSGDETGAPQFDCSGGTPCSIAGSFCFIQTHDGPFDNCYSEPGMCLPLPSTADGAPTCDEITATLPESNWNECTGDATVGFTVEAFHGDCP